MNVFDLVCYLVTFAAATIFFLWNINKRKEDIGSLRFTIKRTLNKTTIAVCSVVLISWIILMVLMFKGEVSLVKEGENELFMFVLVAVATATVFSTILAQFMCKTGFYNMGVIAAGNVVKYKELSEAVFEKKKFMNKDELYNIGFYDGNKKNRGTMLCDEEECEKIKALLKQRNVRIEDHDDK